MDIEINREDAQQQEEKQPECNEQTAAQEADLEGGATQTEAKTETTVKDWAEALETAVGPAHEACLLRRRLQVARRAEGAAVGAVGLLQRADLCHRVRDGAVGAARHGPHLGAGEGADLLDRPIGQAREWFGGGRVRHKHASIVTPCGGSRAR